MGKLRRLLDTVIIKGYIDLLDCDIQIEYKKLGDALAEYGELDPEGFFLEVDETVKSASESVKKGVLASELSHIVKDVKTSSFGRIKDKFLHWASKRYRINDERDTDLTTVLRGFGRELFEAMKFAEEKGFPHYREDGLSLRELEVLINKK